MAALLGAALVCLAGARDFSFTDYEAEALPAVHRLVDGDVSGFLAALPGYGGAVIIQAPFALLGNLVGPDHDLWAWRAQALPGLALLVTIGIVSGWRLVAVLGGARGIAWGALAAALIGGAPFGMLALQTGHAEELLITGMVVIATMLAARGNVALGAALVGAAAVAKPWAVIAVPVVLLAATDRRTATRALVACIVAGALLAAPAVVSGGHARVAASTHSSTSGIFKPDNLFWFAGRPNPEWSSIQGTTSSQLFQRDATKAAWAQRLEPAWAAKVSHPAVVLAAFMLAVAFWRRRGRLAGREDLLLLLSAVCWWRCLLDTWNFSYYAVAALVALTAWEAGRGRPPLLAGVATTLGWVTFQILPLGTLTPDVHTALYLGWALPLGLFLVVRLLAPAAAGRVGHRLGTSVARALPSLAAVTGVGAVREPA